MVNEKLYAFLRERAQTGAPPVSYADAAQVIDLDLERPGTRDQLDDMLGAIDTFEMEKENAGPMLSALVIDPGRNMPDEAFFDRAQILRDYKGHTSEDRKTFAVNERDEVYQYWGGNPNAPG